MRSVIWTLVFLAAACSSKDHAAPGDLSGSTTGAGGTEGTGGTGGSDEDASTDDAGDESNGVVACGTIDCKPGEYCCDGACGACMAIGMNCPIDPCGTGDGAAPE
jgi:hypothetical protein